MKVRDYEILIQDLIPPIGRVHKYFAVIRFLVVESPEGNKRVDPDLGETHGRTKEEAEAKMQSNLDDWLKDNGYRY